MIDSTHITTCSMIRVAACETVQQQLLDIRLKAMCQVRNDTAYLVDRVLQKYIDMHGGIKYVLDNNLIDLQVESDGTMDYRGVIEGSSIVRVAAPTVSIREVENGTGDVVYTANQRIQVNSMFGYLINSETDEPSQPKGTTPR